ncbi:hypothetical protein PgNI_06643 [Pyricularia grisea]|uniref:Uncharacterized protein n=1 Tax=Pyricularia grisea TaxID=148305 RepID=A0A6P8B616_PYRGI|nr:hypothetical protein PgNI_06643 [Pyricularia grisea]TLD10747.1 hypothetical protein PgNI_06643 [Pyricularia grisea]
MFLTTLLNVMWTASTSTRDQVIPVLRVLHSSVNSGRVGIKGIAVNSTIERGITCNAAQANCT